MNRKQQSVVLAGLLAVTLAGCSSFRSGASDSTASTGASAATSSSTASGMDSGSGSSLGGTSSYGSGTTAATGSTDPATDGSMGASGTAGSTASDSGAQQQMPSTSNGGMPAAMPNATVALIEAVPRSAAAGATGSSGSSGNGATGSGSAEDRMYRVTLRMDDGTTRMLTQDSMPGFRTGDRVHMAAGVISQ